MTGPLNRSGKGALVFSAIPRNAASNDFPFFRQKLAKPFNLFIVNQSELLSTKTAKLFTKEAASPR